MGLRAGPGPTGRPVKRQKTFAMEMPMVSDNSRDATRCAAVRAYANGRKDDWESGTSGTTTCRSPLAVFTINNTASTLGCDLTPFFIDRGAHPRLPLSPPRDDRTAGESPARYAQRIMLRVRDMEATVRELLAAAQAERKAQLDAGRMDTVFKVGEPGRPGSAADQRAPRCSRHW